MSLVKANGAGDQSTGFYKQSIDQSLRFDDASNCRMSVVVGDGNGSGGGDRQKFTLSVWLKLSKPGSAARIFEGYTSASQYTGLGFDSGDRMRFDRSQDGVTNTVYSNRVFRDVSNWYLFVWAIDTTQSSETNRVRMYVNGSELTSKGDAVDGYPSQNLNTIINLSGQSTQHAIGRFGGSTGANFDGYMAEMNFIDGTQLTPSSFGETKNGVWIPKSVSSLTYGTLGFRLTFADSSDLGNNANSTDGTNDFTTVSNLNDYDVVPDSPTNNFCTLNALSGASHNASLSEGALKASGNDQAAIGTFGMTSSKWYWEGRCGAVGGGGNNFIGVVKMNYVDKNQGSSHTYGRTYSTNGYIYIHDSSSTVNTSTTYTTGDIIGVAVDLDNGTIKWYKNGTEVSSSTISDLNSHADGNQGWLPWTNFGNATGDFVLNFGQDSSFAGLVTAQNNSDGNGQGDFYYSPPSGYLALCSSNLPEVTISPNKGTQADDHFDTIIYSGSSSNQTLTLSFQADWLWFKERTTNGIQHQFFDSSRLHSTTNAKLQSRLESPNNVSETDSVAIQSQSGNDIVLLGGVSTTNDAYSRTYVMWHWKANGGTTSSNSDGDITSTVQANQTAGFSIVTYTGTGTQSDTVGHGLGKKPAWVLVKSRSEAQNWHIYHHNLDETAPHNYTIFLNADNARASSSSTYWGGSAPTTTVMGVGSDNSSNKNGTTYVMYCFAEIDGYSRFGTYSGNSSADGTYVFTGFRPAMVIFKATHSDSWVIADNKRDPDNQVNGQLFPDLSNAESTSNAICDFLSNGFKLRRNAGSINQNTYIYMAFAEQPFKFSNAR